MIIKHNISALNTVNKLREKGNLSTNALEKLSSGLRINKAADDAAGLAISEKMRAQIRGLNQAERNIQDGISLVQTAEAGLSDIQSPPLQRLRELAVQAANDTLTTNDRKEIQKEVEQIKKSIDDIANNTHFNEIKLLNQEVKGSLITREIVSPKIPGSIIGSANLPSTLNVKSGLNDTFIFEINGESKSITLTPNTYNLMGFENELNNQFQGSNINIKASIETQNKLKFESMKGSSIDSISGNGIAAWFTGSSTSNRTGGIQLAGLPNLVPEVTIEEGVNDTLTFTVDSTSYSITIAPGTYNVKSSNPDLNEGSLLLEEINNQLSNEGAPVKAQFIYYANPDSPYNNGVGLHLSAYESLDGLNYLYDGNHTFGNFGGNAKTTLFDQYNKNWTLFDSINLETGTVITHPATIYGEADLSTGLTIISGENDTLNFNINNDIESIVLNSGTYDASSLLDEINYQMNNNAISITASYGYNNNLILTKNNSFDDDIIHNLSGNAMMDLFVDVTNEREELIITTNVEAEGYKYIHTGANSGDSFEILLTDVRTSKLGLDDISLRTRQEAEKAITNVDEAIEKISSERNRFGVYQNRLDHQLNNISNYKLNLSIAESRIRDVDYDLVAA